jgi:hypothetical protein
MPRSDLPAAQRSPCRAAISQSRSAIAKSRSDFAPIVAGFCPRHFRPKFDEKIRQAIVR